MKLVKNVVLAVILVSTLAVSTLAGETQLPGYVACSPNVPNVQCPPATSTTDETKNPIYSEPNALDITDETSDYLFFEALAALLSVY